MTTQVALIRRHLEAGKSITPMQAIAVYGIFRLASVVEDLRLTGMQIDCVLKLDEMGKRYGEYCKRRPIEPGSTVQVRPGCGWSLPRWVRSLRDAKVLEKQKDASYVQFIRGKNLRAFWLNDKELVRVA